MFASLCVCVRSRLPAAAAANCSFSSPGCISFASCALLVTSNFACLLVFDSRLTFSASTAASFVRFLLYLVSVSVSHCYCCCCRVVVVALCVQCVGKMQRNCLSISRKCFGACNWRRSSFVLPVVKQVRRNRNINRYTKLSIRKKNNKNKNKMKALKMH